MRVGFWFYVLGWAVLGLACTSGATDPGPTDRGVVVDSGPRDLGVRDGNTTDTAVPLDSGVNEDSGGDPDQGVDLDAAPGDAPAPDGFVPDLGPDDSGAADLGSDSGMVDSGVIDTGVVDSGVIDTGVVDTGVNDGGTTPYTHTLVVDGTDDFLPGEIFPTTSAGFSAYVTWDATNLYLGYRGPDLSGTSPTAWVLIYLDNGSGTGAATGQIYNTQAPTFPTGLRPTHYVRWKIDGTFSSVEGYSGGVWSTVGAVTSARAGDLVELSVPWSLLGDPGTTLVTGFLLNEVAFGEAAFAGLYADNFSDGYHAQIPITRWLAIDRASPLLPNDPANGRP
jgi:hypothetical protein